MNGSIALTLSSSVKNCPTSLALPFLDIMSTGRLLVDCVGTSTSLVVRLNPLL